MKTDARTTQNTIGPWDLEDIPYETNDPAGGWYLHFDPTGERSEDVLYMSRAHVSEANARLIAAAPELLDFVRHAVPRLSVSGQHNSEERLRDMMSEARALLARIEGAQD